MCYHISLCVVIHHSISLSIIICSCYYTLFHHAVGYNIVLYDTLYCYVKSHIIIWLRIIILSSDTTGYHVLSQIIIYDHIILYIHRYHSQESWVHARMMVDVHVTNPLVSDLCQVLIQWLCPGTGFYPSFTGGQICCNPYYILLHIIMFLHSYTVLCVIIHQYIVMDDFISLHSLIYYYTLLHHVVWYNIFLYFSFYGGQTCCNPGVSYATQQGAFF